MDIDIAAYLTRLGLPAAPRTPSANALAQLHAAHVARVPFETLHRPTSIDLDYSVDRIVRLGRGGVCYHLNGAFHALLGRLGYNATVHPAATQSRFAPKPIVPNGTHVVLIVADLPTDANPAGRWLVDVGAGEGFVTPLPLVPGDHHRGAFHYGLGRSDLDPSWWRFDHDRKESCRGVDFSEDEVDIADYDDTYRTLAETDMSIFFRYGWVKTHHESGYDELLGCRLSRVDASGRESITITSKAQYFTALRDTFGLQLADLTDGERDQLWRRVFESWTEDGFMSEWTPKASRTA